MILTWKIEQTSNKNQSNDLYWKKHEVVQEVNVIIVHTITAMTSRNSTNINNKILFKQKCPCNRFGKRGMRKNI